MSFPRISEVCRRPPLPLQCTRCPIRRMHPTPHLPLTASHRRPQAISPPGAGLPNGLRLRRSSWGRSRSRQGVPNPTPRSTSPLISVRQAALPHPPPAPLTSGEGRGVIGAGRLSSQDTSAPLPARRSLPLELWLLPRPCGRGLTRPHVNGGHAGRQGEGGSWLPLTG